MDRVAAAVTHLDRAISMLGRYHALVDFHCTVAGVAAVGAFISSAEGSLLRPGLLDVRPNPAQSDRKVVGLIRAEVRAAVELLDVLSSARMHRQCPAATGSQGDEPR